MTSQCLALIPACLVWVNFVLTFVTLPEIRAFALMQQCAAKFTFLPNTSVQLCLLV